MNSRIAYCLSDHTGVTIEAVARSVLSQFPAFECSLIVLPFIDSMQKAHAAVAQMAATPTALAFTSITDSGLRTVLRESGLPMFDLFEQVVPAVEAALGQAATPHGGQTHSMSPNYESRMDALNFSLALDDGLEPQRLDEADLILIGVSRVGKTPTALYLALQYGLRAANYPLTPEDLARPDLPEVLRPHLARLRALTLSAERLAAIRQARYPDSRYASVEQCRVEVAAAERLFRHHGLAVIDTTRMSIEEIAARLQARA
ncbi:MAG: kinase/pyrophosphorylase [Thiobacillus sp.]|nr:kinase/pyrophosphorylase [Thiobacillus sp.]